jgi:hypothetical protein
MDARQELVEHDAECVDIGGGGLSLAAELFRAGVGRREGSELRARERVRSPAVRIEQLGDPEVEQARPSVAPHENVAGLQVAVHDAMRVGIRDRLENGEKEPEALFDRRAHAPNVLEKILAFDVLERQVPGAVCRAARI